MFSKSTDKPEREYTLRTRLVKKSPARTSTVTSSDSKNLKLEHSETLTSKAKGEKRSVKDAQTKKGGITAYSIFGRSEMDTRKTMNRPKEVADSAMEEVKQSGAIFSFKCEERAERRKEARN
ncbi:protein WVD2-like 7 isoform X1 [Iris pallida]|uniref:Protein WVD2-like 7 isoform X1 n=1 Tax=Iris pallida TaxID=29817 RepID=A0AAX6DP28_IRIPA|nr:protein WVD2-like 7 isoform X1 [Iris pallida]